MNEGLSDGSAIGEFLKRCNFRTKSDLVLLSIYRLSNITPKNQIVTTTRLRHALENAPVPEPSNIHSVLSNLEKKQLLKRKKHNRITSWVVTIYGETRVKEVLESDVDTRSIGSADLKRLNAKVQDEPSKEFLEECLRCYEMGVFRSSVVMGWNLVMNNLHERVWNVGPREFNKAVQRRYRATAKKKVRKKDDLLYFRDSELIQLCEDMGLYDRNVRGMLEDHLKLRNKCAHPGKYKPGKKKVEAFFEDVVNNVLL